MVATYVDVTVRNPADPECSWTDRFLMDTGGFDSLVPGAKLEPIGLRPPPPTTTGTHRTICGQASRQQFRADFEDYLNGFSPCVQDSLDKFEFRNQIAKLSKTDALGLPIRKLTPPEINLSPASACTGTLFPTRFVSVSSTLRRRRKRERHDC